MIELHPPPTALGVITSLTFCRHLGPGDETHNPRGRRGRGAALYDGGAGDEWLKALEPIGTSDSKPHLESALADRRLCAALGPVRRRHAVQNYYVPESTGISCGFLLAALHHAGLVTLVHTPNPMKFLNGMLGRPDSEKPIMIIATGHAAAHAKVPAVAKIKKPLDEILTVAE